jgi:Amt family ammonium transporter
MAAQVMIQAKAVLMTIAWSGIGSFVVFIIIGVLVGLRVAEETEREGLDIADHGERAYNL